MTTKWSSGVVASRPNFPAGLRVLLLDPSPAARDTSAQLKQCSYAVTCCTSVCEAAQHLSAAIQSCSSFDVMLVDAPVVSSQLNDISGQLKEMMMKLPTLVMSENAKPVEVMACISMGAAEVIEKPLCPLKLKNIWQHTVRRDMRTSRKPTSSRTTSAAAASAAPAASHCEPAGHDMELCPALSYDLNNTAACGSMLLQSGSPTMSGSSHHSLLAQELPNDKQATCSVHDGLPGHSCSAHDIPGSNSSCSGACQSQAVAAGTPPAVADRQRAATAALARDGSTALATPMVTEPAAAGCAGHAHAAGVAHASQAVATGPCHQPGLPPTGLPSGMVWGSPINPQHVAPGITPPIFPPPVAPAPIPPLLPGQGWPCMAPFMGQPFPGMPSPMLPMMPGWAPPACPPCMPGMLPPSPQLLAGQLPPLPLPMLASMCTPGSVPAGPGSDMGMPGCNPCPTTPGAMAPLDKGPQAMAVDGMLLGTSKTKMPRCESYQLLPSLEVLMADNTATSGGDMMMNSLMVMMNMEGEGEALPLGLTRNSSLDDLISQAGVA